MLNVTKTPGIDLVPSAYCRNDWSDLGVSAEYFLMKFNHF